MEVFSRSARPVQELDGRTLSWLTAGTETTALLEHLIEPGAAIPLHHHEVEELLVCLDGMGRVVSDGLAEPFRTGDTAVIRPGWSTASRTPAKPPCGCWPSPPPRGRSPSGRVVRRYR